MIPPLNPTLLGRACIQIKIKVDTLKVIYRALCEHCTMCCLRVVTILTHILKYFSKSILFGSPFRLEKVPIMSPFHSKMDPHFYKFKNPLHVGAVHDALDNIGLIQSVCGQFKLLKVVFCRKLRFLKTILVFFINHRKSITPKVDYKTIDSMAMVRL